MPTLCHNNEATNFTGESAIFGLRPLLKPKQFAQASNLGWNTANC